MDLRAAVRKTWAQAEYFNVLRDFLRPAFIPEVLVGDLPAEQRAEPRSCCAIFATRTATNSWQTSTWPSSP
eukprot:8574667-Heterocapsa_arctica.AAC.1